MAINFGSALDSVLDRGIAHPGGVRSTARCNVVVDGKLVPMESKKIPPPAIVEKIVENIVESKRVAIVECDIQRTIVESKKKAHKPIVESIAMEKLSPDARYRLANAESIKAKDRERKSAKKSSRMVQKHD